VDKTIIVGIIAAGASITAAVTAAGFSVVTGRAGRRATEELEKQKARWSAQLASESANRADISADRNARRDYEYDARKRLYSEIEPLLFQLFEALEESHYRVRSLARTSRNGDLPAWLGGRAYYLSSTVYKLILPAVFLRLIQRQMTFVDLRVDETIRVRYQLLKLYSRSFTDDFDYAKLNPVIQYDPNSPQWQQLRKNSPQVYVRQGILVGDLESICDTMIVTDSQNRSRAMFFSEFETVVSPSAGNTSLGEVLSLLTGFSRDQRPVIARMLIAQAVMAQLILSTYGAEISIEDLTSRLRAIVSSRTANQALEWQSGVPCPELPMARQYWEERLGWLTVGSSWIEVEG
jgi:hypothetical protein